MNSPLLASPLRSPVLFATSLLAMRFDCGLLAAIPR